MPYPKTREKKFESRLGQRCKKKVKINPEAREFIVKMIIVKLTALLQLQEFSQRNQTWGLRTSTFAARLSLDC